MDLSGAIALVLTVVIGLIAVRLLQKVARRLLSNTKLDARIQRYLLAGLKLVLYVIFLIVVMDRLGINASSLVALLSVAALGLTLAAEDILGNMAGGLVILTSRPFAIGDYIEADGVGGTVEEISLNRTKLITPDGLAALIPNKTLAATKVTNYTALGRRRVKLTVTASYDAPTETVKTACRKALDMTGGLLAVPAPAVYLSGYGESSIEYTVFCWTKAESYWDVYYALTEHLRDAFGEFGVEMTYDHLNVHIVENRS
jgi:small conductance mechanosensitive channel